MKTVDARTTLYRIMIIAEDDKTSTKRKVTALTYHRIFSQHPVAHPRAFVNNFSAVNAKNIMLDPQLTITNVIDR